MKIYKITEASEYLVFLYKENEVMIEFGNYLELRTKLHRSGYECEHCRNPKVTLSFERNLHAVAPQLSIKCTECGHLIICNDSDELDKLLKKTHKFYKPLEIQLLDVAGMHHALRAMRLPKHSNGDTQGYTLGPSDAKLAKALILAGPDHAKAMRGIIAWFEIKMQVGWMIEFETYRCGVECLSTSSSMHNELGGMRGPDLAEKKQAELPDKVYTRIVMMSYQALRSIYKARRSHRHPDWQIFCNYIAARVPYFYDLILPGGKKDA